MYRESSGACMGPGGGRYTVSEGSFLDSAGPGGGRHRASIRAALWTVVFVCAVHVPTSVLWLSGVCQMQPWVSQGLWWGAPLVAPPLSEEAVR